MSEREAQRVDFLNRTGLGDAVRVPLPGDASTRRYERLHLPDGRSLMLMDQVGALESPPCAPDWDEDSRRQAGWNALARLSAGKVEAFAAVAHHLKSHGLSAPEIHALDAPAGLAVLEDLGNGVFAELIGRDMADEEELYFNAVDALARLHRAPPPELIEAPGARWPLLVYDAVALGAGADLFVEWYPRFDSRIVLDDAAVLEWRTLWAPVARRGAEGADAFAHRDYHAENLIWLPDREGAARVGMIDFQDAVRAHPSWDLHSLLQDARRDVSPELERAALDRYFAARPDLDRSAFMADYAALAALNEARILGVFARLIFRDGKPRYRQFMPRMWRHLEANLTAPGMEGLRAWFDRYVPEEVRL
ncbi:MAG: phosphotransferase [Caulobacteraceae bacterium]|nr:phosphotransferase [Caulobacteraceae bacterium]